MNLAEQHRKMEEITAYMRDHDDSHLFHLVHAYQRAFNNLYRRRNLSDPSEVMLGPTITGIFEHLYGVYAEARQRSRASRPPRVRRTDPLYIPPPECADSIFRRIGNGYMLRCRPRW